VNWKRVLHHRYTGTLGGCGFLGWFIVQQSRHESVIIPLVGMILSWIWVLDDVLCEELGWKTPGCVADAWLSKKFWFYQKAKGWLEEKLGGR